MEILQKIGIKDSFRLIKKSENHFAPILEAIRNSLDSIKQRSENDTFIPYIKICLTYIKDLTDTPIFESVSIEDNGIGFNDDCFERFKSLGDPSKRLNNRGNGENPNVSSVQYN